jgi:hypothetical protein
VTDEQDLGASGRPHEAVLAILVGLAHGAGSVAGL